MYYLIFTILIVIIVIYVLLNNLKEKNNKIFYTHRNSYNYILVDNYKQILNKYNIVPAKLQKYFHRNNKIIFIPCSYDNIQHEIDALPKTRNNYYMLINKCDIFVGKNNLWLFLNIFYGTDARTLVPNSYLPYDDKSIEQFKKDYDSNKLYILKKNLQRQEGIKITSDLNEIVNCFKNDKFIIIQELLQNPYLINKRKINMRVYILLVIKNNVCSTYVYNDGFMYYTAKEYEENSIDLEKNITTGYVDRKVYEENPLTHTDFKKLLTQQESNRLFRNINNLIKTILEPFQKYLVDFQEFPNSVQFQLFGADIAVNNDLSVLLMEINKGPDVGSKDERDGKLKRDLLEDSFEIAGILETERKNGFTRVS